MATWTYDNGSLYRDKKLVAELFNVLGVPFGMGSEYRQAALERTNALGRWLAEAANLAEKTTGEK